MYPTGVVSQPSAYGRAPTEREWALVRPFVKEHGLEALGRVIFNTSEFVQAD